MAVSDSSSRAENLRSLAIFAAIVGGLAFEKVPFTRHAAGTLPDGGYYMNIAQHVRDGQWLVSDLSLAHKGAPTLPYPTDMYPLWPVLYGYLARIFPLEALGHWLPALLWFVALGFGYLWARRLWPKPLFPGVLPGFDAGHVFVLLLGLNSEFYRYTSYPYTEALTFTVVLAGLFRTHALIGRPSLRSGLEIGVWIGLATLSRKQYFLLAITAALVYAGALSFAPAARRANAKAALGAALGFVIVCLPDFYWKYHIFHDLSLSRFLRWDQNQHTNVLTPLPMIREVEGVWPYLVDRAAGFEVAFGSDKMSYTNQFYTFQYAVIAALPLCLWLAWQRKKTLVADATRALWTSENLPSTHVALFALAGFFSIHTMHMYTVASWEWMFAGRHALSSIFLIFVALTLLLAHARFPWAAAGVFVLCSGTYLGVARIHEMTKAVEHERAPAPSALTNWLNDERRARGALIVAARQPQVIAHLTPSVGYHWYHDRTSFSDVCGMTKKLHVDYVLVPPQNPAFAQDPAFASAFELVLTLEQTRIYRAKPNAACARAAE